MHNDTADRPFRLEVVPNIKDSNYESNAQRRYLCASLGNGCSEYQR